MKIKLNIYLFLIFSFFIVSCSPATRMERENRSELRKLLREKDDINRNVNFSMERMRIDIQGIMNISGNGKMYIKNDEFMFLSINLIGIEMGRALVTKDSLFYINRLERKYLFVSMNDIQKGYSKRIDYALLQNFVTKGLLLPDRINPRHLIRFFKFIENGYYFKVGNEWQNMVLNYNEKMELMDMEIIDSRSETFLYSEITYQYNRPYRIHSQGLIFNKDIQVSVLPGLIENKVIKKPSMNINERYREIEF